MSELASDALIEDLRLIVGMANVVVDADMRLGFETDWLGRRRGAARVAVRPADTVEVASASSDGIVVSARPADGPPDRLAVAALSGPQDALLPGEAAFGWAATVDLFGDGPG